MKSYKEIVGHVLGCGRVKENRTGVSALTVTGMVFRHHMGDGFPILTTKYVPFRLVSSELEFFIKGMTDKQWLIDNQNHIWDEWCNPQKVGYGHDEEVKKKMKAERDLGPIYGMQWRNFNSVYQPIPNAKIEKTHQPITVLGIGSLGDKSYNKTVPNWQKLRKSWQQMLRRCYAKNDKDYKNYGGRGVYVSDDWLIFSNYLRDIQEIDGWNNKLKNWYEYSIDKDILGGLCYSKQTCLWVNNSDQVMNSIQIDSFRAFNDEEEKIFDSMKECEQEGFSRTCINRCCRGERKTHKGFFWERLRNRKNDVTPGIDQLKILVDTLKTNPNDRRMIVSAWNPNQLNIQSLPPCHYGFQVTVTNGELNLLWNQRSVDVALGLPFNIASYGLLLMLLAKESGHRPGELIGFLADTHIYTNHITGLREQLKRTCHPLPSIFFENFTSIFDWTYKDTKLVGYKHHPAIPFDIAV